jgi:ferritin
MLKNEEIKKIEDFVSQKPRSMQEIADFMRISWRTADRYIEQIKNDLGTIETRVFREGTRGALKIAFLAGVEKISHCIFQEKLEKEIIEAKRKEDFSAFDIFQHVEDKNKNAVIKKAPSEDLTDLKDLAEQLSQAKKQVLLFSGNLSFINLKGKDYNLFATLEELVKRGIVIKILTRVDIAGKENIEKALSLNFKYNKELIEIRHREHPIRAAIIDNKFFRIKEIKEPTGREKELDKKVFIFYTIKDKDWTDWLSRVFWKMFSQSINSNKRIEEINKLKMK